MNNFQMKDLSPQMAEKFMIIEELLEGNYIEIHPVHSFLPSLFYISRTDRFREIPKELKQKSKKVFFSWYAFFGALIAFIQTKFAKDFFILSSLYLLILSLLPPLKEIQAVINAGQIGFSFFVSRIFVASRYQQYRQFGRVPNNRNLFMIILIAIAYLSVASVTVSIINYLLYSPYYAN